MVEWPNCWSLGARIEGLRLRASRFIFCVNVRSNESTVCNNDILSAVSTEFDRKYLVKIPLQVRIHSFVSA